MVDSGLSELNFERYQAEILALRQQHAEDGAKLALLDRLQVWGQDLKNELM
jgi:exodeoxyribonuclease-1